MSKAANGFSAALIIVGIALLAVGGVMLLGAGDSHSSGIGGALTGLAQAIGVGIALAGGLLLLIGIARAAQRGTSIERDAPAAPWPPVIDRSQPRDEP